MKTSLNFTFYATILFFFFVFACKKEKSSSQPEVLLKLENVSAVIGPEAEFNTG
jgi:hypothetical protein